MKIAVTVAALLVACVSSARAEVIRVVGSTTVTSEVMGPHQAEIERLSGQTIVLLPSRSSLGVFGLFEGHQIAMISSSMKDLLVELKRQRPELAYDRLRIFNLSRTRVAFSVNRGNSVRYADPKTLQGILTGEITSWREVGGSDLPIRIVMVGEGGGVQATIESQLKLKVVKKNTILVQISSQVNKVVEQLPEALGLAQIENLRGSDAVELKTERPIEQELNLVTLDDPPPSVLSVIEAAKKVAAGLADSQTNLPSR
jgi:phosphate transport system substrate-binding protein